MADFITLDVVASEDSGFTFVITPSMAFSSLEKFRWELTFGQGELHRGVITFKAGESDSRSISQSIDPDKHYQIRVFRVSDNNNDTDDELLFQQQSAFLLPPVLKDTQPHNAPQQEGIEGDQGTEITKINAALVLNKNEVTVIDATALLYRHPTPTDPNTELTYTLTENPVGGDLFRDGVKLSNGDTFTQNDIDAGLITYRFIVADNNPTNIAFTVSSPDGPLTLSGQTLQITPREVFDVQNPHEDNDININRSGETAPQKIDTGDGSDTIIGGEGDDQINAGAGDDEITLTLDDDDEGNPVEAGADEVLYTFGYGGDGTDGGDAIKGFRRGQDKLKFVVNSDRTDITTLTEFLQSLSGADGEYLTDDDAFTVTMMWGFDENGVFYFDGVLLHFKEASAFSNGPLSSPVVSITFDERLGFDDLVEILGGAENVADNFDGGLTAFKNLDEVLPRLFGEDSIDFEVRPIDEVSVIDGPVAGAEVFFDLNGDGEVTDAEKDAQRDESGRSRYLTGDDGTVDIPEQYVGRAFVAVVGSAYDIDSGERLEGEFRSLDEGRGGIATPITDLIVTYLEEVEGQAGTPTTEVEGQAGTPTTEQEVLDKIFGDDVVTLADILDAGNYELPESGAPGEEKKQMISRAAIALTEIKENDDLTDGDGDGSTTKVEIVSALKTLADSPDDTSVAELKEVVEARVAEVNAVKGGKPIATPASVDGVEDTDYAFPDTPEALTGLFGFRDPSGNDPAADTSSFRGVYIRIDIENASLRLDDNTQIVADTDLSGSDTADAIADYVYVTFDNLDNLKITPAPNFNGDLTLVYRVWDGEEVSSDAELIINIAGVNDAPVISDESAATEIGEDTTPPIEGTLSITDVDDTVVPTVALDGDGVGQYGTLTFTPSASGGAWSYALDDRAQALKENQTETETFTFTAVGAEAFELIITVVGANDAPVIVPVDVAGEVLASATGTVTEDTSPTATGTLTIMDIDGDALPVIMPPNDLSGTYGAITFVASASGGTWTYTLDDRAQALKEGQEETETFTFTAAGAEAITVTITVRGVNDAPVISNESVTTEIGEDTTTSIEGTLSITDVDDTVVPAVALEGNGVGQYGTLTFTATGTGGGWSYALDDRAQALKESQTETFTFTADGAEDFELIITVIGVNDAPVISDESATTEIGEDATTPIEGTLSITDVDDTVVPAVALDGDGVGQYGTLTFTPSASGGGWSYALDDRAQALKENQTETFTFTADGAEAFELIITVIGANDAPVISDESATTEIGEDATTPIEGTLSITDVDDTVVPTIALDGNGVGQYGTLTFTPSASGGGWSYALDDRAQALKESQTETFTFTADGAEAFELIITVIGANDAPVIVPVDVAGEVLASATGTVTEDTSPTATGTLTIMDIDGDALPVIMPPNDLSGTYGAITFVASASGGTWTYTLDDRAQALKEGQEETETFTFTAAGAEAITVTITVSGVNDVPVISNESVTTEIGEDATTPIEGTLSITDVDDTVVPAVALDGNGAGQYGTLTFTATGTGGGWSYALDERAQALKESQTETFTFTADGAEAFELIITVVGANDAPVISNESATTEIGEDATTPIEGTLSITDVDDTVVPAVALDGDGVGQYGTLTFTATGTGGGWSYVLDERAQTLDDGPVTETFTFTADGAEAFELIITVVGANDAPVISDESATTEIGKDTTTPIEGTLSITDVDDTVVPAVALDGDGVGQYGTLTFTPSVSGGGWSYVLDNTNEAVQALGDDEVLTDEFIFTAEGAEDVMVTITVVGVNDAPRITGPSIPPQSWNANEEIVDINLSNLFTDPEGDEFTITVTLDNGRALETIGLSYNLQTGIISGRLSHRASGDYVIKIVARDSNAKASETSFEIEVAPLDDIIRHVGQEIPEIYLSQSFFDGSGTLLTVSVAFLDDLGRVVDFGLEYVEIINPRTTLVENGMIRGTPSSTGTYMIQIVSTDSETGKVYQEFITFVVEPRPPTLAFANRQRENVADFTATEDVIKETSDKAILIDDPDGIINNPEESSRNQVGISAGVQGGSAADVATARVNFKSDYDDADVRVRALVDLSDAGEEEYIVEGEYGRFTLAREEGSEKLRVGNGGLVTLTYYYKTYQKSVPLPNGEEIEDHRNYKNINALKEGEKAYDVLTVWGADNLTPDEESQFISNNLEVPQTAIDRRVFKTVVVEIIGVNDAPEVLAETFDVFYTTDAELDIAIDPDNFFDVDGDDLMIDVTLDDNRALSALGDTVFYDSGAGKITGTITATGEYTVRVTATDPHGGHAGYTFNLSNALEDVETRPVVEIFGEQNEFFKRAPIAAGTDTGFEITYRDADDAYLENDEVVYEFYLLGANGGKRLIDYFSVDPEGNIIFRIENRFISDLAFEVVAIDGEGSESAPQHFTITVTSNPSPSLILASALEEEVSEKEAPARVQLHRLIIQDEDTAADDFNPSSFTITGEQADKFAVEKADDRWYLFLKRGESPDHESLDDGAINLQIMVSDGIHTSNAVEVVINVIDVLEAENPPVITGEDQGFYIQKLNGGRQIVYRTIAESDGVDTEEIYSLENGGDNDLFEINERGEVRFKPGAVPPFDTAASFEITIIVRDPNNNRAEKGVTIYSNSPSDISGAVPLGQPNTDSPSDQALGYTIGPDDVPTDADGVVRIDYYWFTDNRPYSGSKNQIGLQKLIDGEVKDSRGDFLTPLAGENERFLTLKGEHAEKIIWLVVAVTDGDEHTRYYFWAVSSGGRYDIADSFEGALALADIGIEGAGGTLEMVGHLSRDNDKDFISFTVEAGETLTINLGLTDVQPDGQENQSRAADYRILNADGTEFEARKSLAEGRQDRFVVSDAGHYILEVSQSDSSGFYKIGFEGLNDKPTALVLTDHVTDLASDVDLSVGQKVGVITITDDIYGTNTIVLTGADAELFEIREAPGRDRLVKELWLKAGADLGAPGEAIEVIASVEGTGEGRNPEGQTLIIKVVLLDVTGLDKELSSGALDTEVGDAAAASSQFLIGDGHAQTFHAGTGGDVIFGGKGDDTINLGLGADTVVYRYDGADATNLAAYDGGDVINGFDLDEDALVLSYAGSTGNVHDNAAAFYGAIKDVGLLVDGDGNITGIVFTFTDRGVEAGVDDEIDLTVNFDNDFNPSSSLNDHLDDAFEAAASGERVITAGQETAAYQAINAVLGESLVLVDFADIGFELNSAETDIV